MASCAPSSTSTSMTRTSATSRRSGPRSTRATLFPSCPPSREEHIEPVSHRAIDSLAVHGVFNDSMTRWPDDSIAMSESMPSATQIEPVSLSNDEILRYSRHLIMPEVGMDGQLKLKAAKVLCIGAGGLGSPLALYLAAAGVGTLGIVDFDVVDSTNLQRQIIHTTADVGRRKLESAADKLKAINPFVQVRA